MLGLVVSQFFNLELAEWVSSAELDSDVFYMAILDRGIPSFNFGLGFAF